MSRSNPAKLALLIAILAGLAPVPVLLSGGLHVTHYDGDALHLADIVRRMADGARPHVDFMTPLGALGFAPVALFMRMGADLGLAFALGQALFAAAAGAGVFWASYTRLPRIVAYGFAAAAMLVLTSLSHGADGGIVAVSMHYNRWAWVVVFVAVLLAVLPPLGPPRPWIDGAAIAAAMAALALLKATYLVAFAPALVLVLLVRRELGILGAALAAGAVLGGALVLWLGLDHWLAYLGDLRAVAATGQRTSPGLPIADLVVSPANLPATLTILGAAVVLRRTKEARMGLALVLLFPAFIYVTWQNFGNDPLWLVVLAPILIVLRPPVDHAMRPYLRFAIVAAMVLSAPLLFNHALSGPRLLTLPKARAVVLVPGAEGLLDVTMPRLPARLVRGRLKLNEPGAAYAVVEDPQTRGPVTFAGEIFVECQVQTGIPGALGALAADLEPDDGAVFVADIVSAHWLYAGAAPLPGGAPWNYGTLSGIGAADHVLVPLCPVSVAVRRAVLDRLAAEGPAVTEVRRTPRMVLYRIER